jgi:hypothetical protein
VLPIRLAGLFFAFVQITLFLRLLLPFVELPPALVEYVPPLMEITDAWLAPVVAVVERFELADVAETAVEIGEGLVSGPQAFEPVVIVAMVFWALLAGFAMFVLRLIFRPAG